MLEGKFKNQKICLKFYNDMIWYDMIWYDMIWLYIVVQYFIERAGQAKIERTSKNVQQY